MTAVLIGLAAWFFVSCLLGPPIGRRLRRNQPPATATTPEEGNHV